MSTSSTQTKIGQSTWKLDPTHSRVEFGVRHMMISTVKGTFRDVEGHVVLDDADVGSTSLSVEIDAKSIDTGSDDRDTHLRSADFFDVEQFPSLRFRSTSVTKEGNDFRISGELTIRDQTRPVELEVESLGGGVDPWGNERLGFHATTRINRKDFGLTWNQALEAGGVLVGDEVRIALDVQIVQDTDSTEV